MGTERPNPKIPKMAALGETAALSRRLGLIEKCIIFNDWVPYASRQNYLLEADIGLSLHRDIAENRFAFRTRFMDYLWAGLPSVATEGDVLSDVVRDSGLGRLVAPGRAQSPGGLSNAFRRGGASLPLGCGDPALGGVLL